MPGKVGIGMQDFRKIRERNAFYIDKTLFIKEWWESLDDVTLITRPRRFGKTLTMSMVENFYSLEYASGAVIFEGLDIWKEEKYRNLQGTFPVISLSFANIKEVSYEQTRKKICQILVNLYSRHSYLLESNVLTKKDRDFYQSVSVNMDDATATFAIYQLSEYLCRYYGKKVLIFLDEYDTPMQEAYVNGYWKEMADFIRSMLNAAFKTNPFMERAIMTGITRITRESVFSDLNNLEIVTITSEKYESFFGFTEDEVFAALDEFGLSEDRQRIKEWYDGFTFGKRMDMYNPWSILNYLDKRKFSAYWANSSSNELAERLVRKGSFGIKTDLEELIKGHSIEKSMDEQVVFKQLDRQEEAVWSLFLACGYLKTLKCRLDENSGKYCYELTLTNKEVQMMFIGMIRGWFSESRREYSAFTAAMLTGNLELMNEYMNKIAMNSFSFFDVGGKTPDSGQPESFYHGFVLGLVVELDAQYVVLSNRESGLGRYDVVLEPKDRNMDAIIMEFKAFDQKREKTLEDTVIRALNQIEEKEYAQELIARGIPEEKIHKYGFGFKGKQVLIDTDYGSGKGSLECMEKALAP